MLKISQQSSLAALLTAVVSLSFTAKAEQPQAQDLVGKIYGGIHAMHIETDNDRLMTADPKSSLDNGDGLGFDVGYRWLPSTEFRLSYSQFNLNARNEGYPEPDGNGTSVDMLFFPTEKSFYFLTGVNRLDIQSSQVSANIGAGYRHYLSDRMGLYFETKAHYQFSEHYDELTAQVGFVYFFGDNDSKSTVAAAAVILDADKDGVIDELDLCANTPMIDKVDSNGCTIFIDDELSIQLLVQFDNDKAVIKPEYYKEINVMADFLLANPDTSITIEGHASSPGSAVHNKQLSQQRADAIVEMLITKYSINANRLSAIGYGEEQLLTHLSDESAHAQNRRTMATVKVSKRTSVKR